MEQIIAAIRNIAPYLDIAIYDSIPEIVQKPNQICLVFSDLTDCTRIQLPTLSALLNKDMNIQDGADVLGVMTHSPIQLRIFNKDKTVPGAIPLAAVHDNIVQLAIPQFIQSTAIVNMIASGLEQLLQPTATAVATDTSETHFIAGIEHTVQKRKASLERELALDRVSAEKFLTKAQQYQTVIQEKEALLHNLTSTEADNKAYVAKQTWKQLQTLVPKVFQSIIASSQDIVGTTHPITIDGVLLGTYKIHIRFRDLDVTAFREPRQESTQHPHVHGGGGICWGNMSTRVNNLRANSDILGLLNAALILLNTYNSRDAYRKISAFATAGSRSDAGYPTCTELTLRGDLILQCRSCRIDTTITHNCSRRESPASIYQACKSAKFPPEIGCAHCADESCPTFAQRFDTCFEDIINPADDYAYCVLRCTAECSLVTKISQHCERFSLLDQGRTICPAIENCRQPCKTATEAAEQLKED